MPTAGTAGFPGKRLEVMRVFDGGSNPYKLFQ